MKKKIFFIILLTILIVLLCACKCKHAEYSQATCTTPSACLKCESILLPESGHDWSDATCTLPRTCTVCQSIDGDPLGHSWIGATCILPQTCATCQETEGDPLGHSWIGATCILPQTCATCQETEGDALGHSYKYSILLAATCTEKGTKQFSCEKCEDTYQESYSCQEYAADEIYELSKSSVGEVVTFDKKGQEIALGTCFVYDKGGKIITNYHVIEDAYSIKITLNDKTYDVKQILAYDKNIDIAVLKINATDLPFIPICYNEHAAGKTIYTLGSSQGLTLTFSQGIITHSSREIDNVIYIQHDSAISSGNSGGPLINQYGEIIGINTWAIKDSQNLNFAISTNELKNLKYEKPLTVKEFYEKEFNVFLKIKNHIIQTGTYDASEKEYELSLFYYYQNGSRYSFFAEYAPADDEILIYMTIKGSMSTIFTLTIDEIDGTYEWDYVDSLGAIMYGTLYANTFTKNSYLTYTNYYMDYSLVSTIRELASAMAHVLLSTIDISFETINVTTADLGFTKY